MYRYGHGVKQSYSKAIYWYKRILEQEENLNKKSICFGTEDIFGSVSYALGDIYYKGIKEEKNYAEAFEWYKKAIEDRYEKVQEKLDEILKKV